MQSTVSIGTGKYVPDGSGVRVRGFHLPSNLCCCIFLPLLFLQPSCHHGLPRGHDVVSSLLCACAVLSECGGREMSQLTFHRYSQLYAKRLPPGSPGLKGEQHVLIIYSLANGQVLGRYVGPVRDGKRHGRGLSDAFSCLLLRSFWGVCVRSMGHVLLAWDFLRVKHSIASQTLLNTHAPWHTHTHTHTHLSGVFVVDEDPSRTKKGVWVDDKIWNMYEPMTGDYVW